MDRTNWKRGSAEINDNDNLALKDFKNRVLKEFSGARFILFGSKARKECSIFSDIDVLVILEREITTNLEKRVFDIGFETGLKFGVVFGIVVEESKFLESALAKAMPFYQNVIKEGLVL